MNTEIRIPVRKEGDTAIVSTSGYLNKITGEKIERECITQINAGCKSIVLDFEKTEIVNSIGVSILLGVIDAASNAGADIVFSGLNQDTAELFETLGLTNHVTLQA